MNPAGQLLWRNRHLLAHRPRPLFLLAEADALAQNLHGEGIRPHLHTHLWSAHRYFSRLGLDSAFGTVPRLSAPEEQIVLFQPREKNFLALMLNFARAALAQNGELLLVGENREGIKSAGKRLSAHFAAVQKVDAARHCTLFRAQNPLTASRFDIDQYVTLTDVDAGGKRLTVASLPGVFAHGRLDEGTRLIIGTILRAEWFAGFHGNVLDFACGSGVIGTALKREAPHIELTMSDDSALALDSAQETMKANGLTAKVIASDGLRELTGGDDPPRFELIVSNPPFHTGARQQLNIARRLIVDSEPVLAPAGRLVLVANVHLPYRAWLMERYGKVEVIANNRGYNVWLAGHD